MATQWGRELVVRGDDGLNTSVPAAPHTPTPVPATRQRPALSVNTKNSFKMAAIEDTLSHTHTQSACLRCAVLRALVTQSEIHMIVNDKSQHFSDLSRSLWASYHRLSLEEVTLTTGPYRGSRSQAPQPIG